MNRFLLSLWKIINSFSGKHVYGYQLISRLVYENEVLEGNANIINALNKHFTNISNIIEKTNFVTTNFANLSEYIQGNINCMNQGCFDIQLLK